MNIAVTGATGHLGQLVVNGLLEQRGSAGGVVAVVRNGEKARPLAERGADVRVAAYTQPDALKAALAGVERLLLISGSEVGQRVEQHRNVIDAAKAAGVRQVVYTSAPKATTSSLILAPEHKATEEYLSASGLGFTVLRNNWYTENYVPTVEAAQHTGAVYAAAGNGRVASATRADYAAGAVAVLLGEGHTGKVYELGGDTAWDFNELAQTVGELIGRPVEYRPVDADTLIGILQGAGMDEGTARFLAALDGNIAEGALAEVTGDLSGLIGRPTTPLKQGLAEALGR